MGISGKVSRWIKNWLEDREQRVVSNGEGPKWVKVRSGVPQGSVRDHLQFFIYMNDIYKGVVSKILKFDEDTNLCGEVGSLNEINTLKNDLCLLMEWSEEWQMLFNVEKCDVMHFRFNNALERYEMNDKQIVEVSEEKDLGTVIQNDL